MTDRKKVIKGLESQLDDLQKYADADEALTLTQDQAKGILSLLKEQDGLAKAVDQEHLVNEYLNKRLADRPEIVRCKDCIHRGKSEKCVLSAISEEKGFPLFILDNHGDWFCADGKRKEG